MRNKEAQRPRKTTKDMTELETIKITVERPGEEPEVMETKSLLMIMADPEKMDVIETSWNAIPDMLALHLAHMEQVKLEEGKSVTHDTMQKLPKWRRIVKRTNRKKGQVAAALRKLLGL